VSGPLTIKALFTNKEASPVVLGLVLLKEFGSEYLDWEADTIWKEIEKTWGTTTSEANKNKIQAIRTCHVTDLPYEAWETFEKVSMGLMGYPPRFDVMQQLTPHMAAVAIDTMQQIRNFSISREVYKYVAAAMLDFGMVYGLGPLQPANEYIKPLVPEGLPSKVAALLESGRKPSFDKGSEHDIQIVKVRSVEDVLSEHTQALLEQMDVLFGTKGE
jgi:hypothetical protein